MAIRRYFGKYHTYTVNGARKQDTVYIDRADGKIVCRFDSASNADDVGGWAAGGLPVAFRRDFDKRIEIAVCMVKLGMEDSYAQTLFAIIDRKREAAALAAVVPVATGSIPPLPPGVPPVPS